MDPLKHRAFGVKKTVGDISRLAAESQQAAELAAAKRAYPMDAKGNIDEWAAVVQKQSDIHTLQK